MNTPRFTANNNSSTRVFIPMHNGSTVASVLSRKQLRFDIDASTGMRRSKDGRKQNPNTALAEAISYRYGYFEPVHVKIRAISSTAQNAGMINFNELRPIRSDDILQLIMSLKNAGVILRYTNYGNCVYIELNPNAKHFYDKQFSQLHILNVVNKKRVDEVYYDCTLTDVYGDSRYVVDMIYRERDKVTFVVSALSQKIMLPAQLERIVRLANRLKSITLVISPSVNIDELMDKLTYAVNSGVKIKLIPYTKLNLL